MDSASTIQSFPSNPTRRDGHGLREASLIPCMVRFRSEKASFQSNGSLRSRDLGGRGEAPAAFHGERNRPRRGGKCSLQIADIARFTSKDHRVTTLDRRPFTLPCPNI